MKILTGRCRDGLDVVPLAAADARGDALDAVVTYEVRMPVAAERLGFSVAQP